MSNIEDFQTDLDDLELDISHINDRLNNINKNMILLQHNIDRLTNLILHSSNSQVNANQGQGSTQQKINPTNYYTIQNEALKVLSLYNDNYQRLLDLKFKYRTSHGEFKLKTRRFIEVELKRLEAGSDTDMSYNQVLKALSKLSTTNDNTALNFDFNKDEII